MASGGASRIREMLARLEGRVKARTVDRPWFRWVVWAAVGLVLLSVAMYLVTGIGALATRRPVDNPVDLLMGDHRPRRMLYGRYEWQFQAAACLLVGTGYLVLGIWLVRWWRRHERERSEGGGVAGAST